MEFAKATCCTTECQCFKYERGKYITNKKDIFSPLKPLYVNPRSCMD